MSIEWNCDFLRNLAVSFANPIKNSLHSTSCQLKWNFSNICSVILTNDSCFMYKDGRITKLLTDFLTSLLKHGRRWVLSPTVSNKMQVREMPRRDLTAKADRLICITNLELIKDKLWSELKVVVWRCASPTRRRAGFLHSLCEQLPSAKLLSDRRPSCCNYSLSFRKF